MDFTFSKYSYLISSLIEKQYAFQTFEKFIQLPLDKVIILRHDVDLRPRNSLKTAIIENKLGIQGSYYFRMVPESYDIDTVKQIADLGHEIGYHYETMDSSSERLKWKHTLLNEKQKEQLVDAAYNEFCENLETFRTVYPVKTICMHGSPKSKFDNRTIWEKYNYKLLEIAGEPYYDIDFNKFFYLTDTGRCWNGYKFSVRDKMPQQERWIKEGLVFKTTNNIMAAAKLNKLPNQIMITVHPQRWDNNIFYWTKELTFQRLKNIVKWVIVNR